MYVKEVFQFELIQQHYWDSLVLASRRGRGVNFSTLWETFQILLVILSSKKWPPHRSSFSIKASSLEADMMGVGGPVGLRSFPALKYFKVTTCSASATLLSFFRWRLLKIIRKINFIVGIKKNSFSIFKHAKFFTSGSFVTLQNFLLWDVAAAK